MSPTDLSCDYPVHVPNDCQAVNSASVGWSSLTMWPASTLSVHPPGTRLNPASPALFLGWWQQWRPQQQWFVSLFLQKCFSQAYCFPTSTRQAPFKPMNSVMTSSTFHNLCTQAHIHIHCVEHDLRVNISNSTVIRNKRRCACFGYYQGKPDSLANRYRQNHCISWIYCYAIDRHARKT